MSVPRPDLFLEVNTTLDASGSWTGPWVDSSGVRQARLLWQPVAIGTVAVETSIDGVNPLEPGGDPADGDLVNVVGRYFRVVITGGAANAAFWLLGRSWTP